MYSKNNGSELTIYIPEDVLLNEVEIEAECNELLLEEVIEKFGKKIDIRPISKDKFKMKLSANPVGFKMWAMRNLDIVTVT